MTTRRTVRSICLGMLLLTMAYAAASREADPTEAGVPIRIGWQMPAVTQAGLVQVLKRTDVLAQHGFDPSLVPFSYGTPQIEAALVGRLDVLFAGDQPVINLCANGGKWKIVARAFFDRIATIVPRNSPIEEVADLRGRVVASPFGSVGHREALLAQEAAGLDPEADVENVDMDVFDIQRRVLGGGIESWGDIDAAAVWEPNLSSFELAGISRNLTESHTLGLVAMSEEFIAEHPEAAVQFLVALMRAWEFWVEDPARVMRWYSDDTQLGYSHESLVKAVRIDPNFQANSLQDIDIELHERLVAELERNAAWGIDTWEEGGEIRQFVDQELLARAKRQIESASFEKLEIILPSVRAVESIKSTGSYGLDSIPLGILFAIMVAVALLAIELGLRQGRRARTVVTHESARPIGTVAGATLGMMAFVIALTFGSATNRFDARKTALLDDVTAIQTAYLRASLLPEPHRTTVQSLLRDYVQARVGIVHAYGRPETLRFVERHAHTLQTLMWSHVETMANVNASGYESFASALAEVFNLHTRRIVLGAYYRIPGFLWWAILFASAVAMVAVGFQFGVVGGRVPTAKLALALTFALVMMLAFDLDRAGEGLVSVNQKPMIDLYQSLSSQR